MSIREEDELLGTYDLYDLDELDELESCDLDEVFFWSSFDRELNEELELGGIDRSWQHAAILYKACQPAHRQLGNGWRNAEEGRKDKRYGMRFFEIA